MKSSFISQNISNKFNKAIQPYSECYYVTILEAIWYYSEHVMLSHMILLSPWDKIPCWPLLHRPKLTPALCQTLIDKHITPALLTPYHEICHSIQGERNKGQQGIWHYFECITKSLWRNLVPESVFNSFTTEVPIIQKPVHDFHQWTGFYMRGTSVMKELRLLFQHKGLNKFLSVTLNITFT